MSPIQKKQNRGIETRERILAVTQQLLSDHDFHSVTLDQISEHAEISKSSLLWHFESKEMLLSEAACELFRDLEEAVIVNKDDSLSFQNKMKMLVDALASYYEENPEPKGVLIGLIFNSQIPGIIRERIDEYWEHHATALVEYFSYPDKTFPLEAAHSILDIFHGSYMHWYLHRDKENIRERLFNSVRFLNFE